MSVKFFGQYLLEQGKIIKEELLDALEFQKKVNAKLGTIALDAGYLTAEQVERIHSEQQRTDKLFGEIAIGLNYLTPEQLEELLIIQKNERISLGDALIQKGYLTLSELEEVLKEFKRSQEVFIQKAKFGIVKSTHPEFTESFIDLTIKFLRRLTDIEVEVIASHNNPEKIAPYIWNVYQNFFGDTVGFYMLSLHEKSFLQIASGIAQEKLREIDDFAKDGVKEFINTLVGNTAARLSQHGIKIDLKPPNIAPSVGLLQIPPEVIETVSVTLAASQYEMQMSLLYSAINDKKK